MGVERGVKKMKVDVVNFVNDGGKREIFKPIIVKLIFFTVMITLAVILYFRHEQWAGIVLYIKEVTEFALFLFYLKGRRKAK